MFTHDNRALSHMNSAFCHVHSFPDTKKDMTDGTDMDNNSNAASCYGLEDRSLIPSRKRIFPLIFYV